MEHHNMIDLGHSGPHFTWTNNRHGHNNIQERLDSGVANLNWNNLFPDATIKTLPMVSSDQSPILLESTSSQNEKKSFKLEEFWIRDQTSFEVVKKAWHTHFVGTPAYILTRKLKATKLALKH